MVYRRSNIPHWRCIDLETEPINDYGNEMMLISTWLYKTGKWYLIALYKPLNVNDKSPESVFQTYVTQWKGTLPTGYS